MSEGGRPAGATSAAWCAHAAYRTPLISADSAMSSDGLHALHVANEERSRSRFSPQPATPTSAGARPTLAVSAGPDSYSAPSGNRGRLVGARAARQSLN